MRPQVPQTLRSSSAWQAFIPYSEHIPRPSPGLAVNFLVHAQVCFSFLFLPLPGTPLAQLFGLSSVNPNMECCPLSWIPSPKNILPGVLLRGHSPTRCCSQLKISRSAPEHVLSWQWLFQEVSHWTIFSQSCLSFPETSSLTSAPRTHPASTGSLRVTQLSQF